MADLKDTYVVHGAWTTCTCGIRKSRIVLEKSHGIFLKNRELMTVNDCKPENIICFGGCYSMENPDTAAEAQKIQMAVEKDCPNTFTDTVMNFFTKKGQKESSDAPLQVVGICNPKIISAEWDNGGNTVEVNGEVPLLAGAKVHCLYGGEIEIIDSGQPEAGDMSQVEISPHSVPLSGSPGSNAESAAMGAAAAGIAATPGMPKQVAAGMIGASKASNYGKSETIDVEGSGNAISSQGIAMIANFELSEGSAKKWGIGEFDANGKMTGIYPHYVFKNIGTQDNPKWVSDGGITFGHGIYVTKSMYDTDPDIKKMVDKYAPGASFVPPSTPRNGVPYKVPNSIAMPIAVETPLYETKLKDYEDAVNNFLNKNNITLKQNQFDALVSFTYNYGVNWWDKDKVMPNFIRDGEGVYDPEEVRRVFGMHDNPTRRLAEAEVFINGY